MLWDRRKFALVNLAFKVKPGANWFVLTEEWTLKSEMTKWCEIKCVVKETKSRKGKRIVSLAAV